MCLYIIPVYNYIVMYPDSFPQPRTWCLVLARFYRRKLRRLCRPSFLQGAIIARLYWRARLCARRASASRSRIPNICLWGAPKLGFMVSGGVVDSIGQLYRSKNKARRGQLQRGRKEWGTPDGVCTFHTKNLKGCFRCTRCSGRGRGKPQGLPITITGRIP